MITQTQMRNRAFIETCRTVAANARAQGRVPEIRAIVRQAIFRPAPSYYMGYASGIMICRRLMAMSAEEREALPARPSNVRARHFVADVEEYMQRTNTRCVADAVTHVLNHGRPRRFYISMRIALQLAYLNFTKTFEI